ncbi:MAG: acyl-CoA thioesterase domain-containing protein, partial [Candidatus Thorarchaeota archaeon]
MSSKNPMHPFDEAVELTPTSSSTYEGCIPETYANMVGPFGGIIVAVILNGILCHKERQGDPVSITVNFAGPIAYTPFELTVRLIRTNRSNQHWIAELTQESIVAATDTAIL